MISALILDLGETRLLDRTVAAVLEAGMTHRIVVLDQLTPGRNPLTNSGNESGPELLLRAGEVPPYRLIADPGHANHDLQGRWVVAPHDQGLLPDPFGLSGNRLLNGDESRANNWKLRHSLNAPPGGPAPIEIGTVAEPPLDLTAGARSWLLEAMHQRELQRGASHPNSDDELLDAVCLAWAGEYEGCLSRALHLTANPSVLRENKVIAARALVAASFASGRYRDAANGLRTWWMLGDAVGIAYWARLLSLLAPDFAGDMRPLEDSLEHGEPATSFARRGVATNHEPWDSLSMKVRLDQTRRELKQLALQFLKDRVEDSRPMTGGEGVGVWQTWHKAQSPFGELLKLWPKQSIDLLRVMVESGLQYASLLAWQELAIEWASQNRINPRVVELVLELVPELPLESTKRWETIFRQQRQKLPSPLLNRSRNGTCSIHERIMSGAALFEFGLVREGSSSIRSSVRDLPPEDLSHTMLRVSKEALPALPTLVSYAAEVEILKPALADALDTLGRQDLVEALALRQ